MPQSLIIMQNERITFSSGTNYHEILPKTFIEQLLWNEGALLPYVVYPQTMPGIEGDFAQMYFTLPPDYEPGGP